uniref:Dynein light chain n=1 Tax=Panagrolaimus sp. PS1159 TaxID=55785 RepID=A0AC35GG59_9BILA
MATKTYDSLLHNRDFVNSLKYNGQYKNFNLNQNHQNSLNAFLDSSKSLSTEKRKVIDYDSAKKDLNLWKKSAKDFSQNLENDGFKKEDVGLKKNSNINNSSSLSLHIEAYENEASFDFVDDSTKERLKQISKNEKQLFINFTKSVIQNPFEFPRQRENDEAKDPEIAQYKASQLLLNPTQSSHLGSGIDDTQETSRTGKGAVVKINGKNVNLKFNTKFTVTIKASELPPEMIEKAVLLADEAMQKYNDDGDIAQHIKHGFDMMISPPWHCVVGRKFSSLITHKKGYFLYFFIGKLACVLFKARS